jgi:hypothetical protein
MIWYRIIPEQKLHGFARKPSALTGLFINRALGKHDPVKNINHGRCRACLDRLGKPFTKLSRH